MSTTAINSRTKLITPIELDFQCDLTTNSFFAKWGVKNNPEQPDCLKEWMESSTQEKYITKQT